MEHVHFPLHAESVGAGEIVMDDHRRLGSPSFTVTIDIMTVTLVVSAAFYGVCCHLSRHKLKALHALQPQLTTQKLLILSVLLVSVLRIMTILGVAAMNMANVRAHYSLQPNTNSRGDKTQDFYDEAMTVLFDLPNCIVVSTYVLLTLVWAECFLEARFHTENAMYWKRRLLIGFMIFNTLLYTVCLVLIWIVGCSTRKMDLSFFSSFCALQIRLSMMLQNKTNAPKQTQLILYACIFFSVSNTLVRVILYAAITGINFTAVAIVLVFYVYLNIRFSGFPYRSEEMKASLTRMSTVMTLWSFTRVIWGIATLLVYIHNVELLQDTDTPARSFALLLVVFFVCEILPIIILLDYSYYARILQPDDTLTLGDVAPAENHEIVETERDALLYQRSLNTVDHLLLTSPRDGIIDTGNRSRRVRFVDTAQAPQTPLLVENP